MKTLIATLTFLAASSLAVAQTPSKPAAVKPVSAKPVAAKPAAAKPAAKTSTAKASTAKAVPAAVPEPELGAAELAVADLVHLGHLPCELGASVQLRADPVRPGYFDLQIQKTHYRMVPVTTTTGAIRLEDAKAGAVWLQLANKSMLMNHKLGQRMADECQSERQMVVAERLKTQPAPSVLEPLPAVPAVLVAPAAPDLATTPRLASGQ